MGILASDGLSRSWMQALRLLLVAIVLASAGWMLRPDPLPFVADPLTYELEVSAPLIELGEAFLLFDEGNHLFIDTRSMAGPEVETIAGSFLIREASFDDDLLRLMDDFFPEDPVVLFGDGNLMGVSNVAAKLQERGYESVSILRSGLQAWRDGGGDISLPYFPEPSDMMEDGS